MCADVQRKRIECVSSRDEQYTGRCETSLIRITVRLMETVVDESRGVLFERLTIHEEDISAADFCRLARASLRVESHEWRCSVEQVQVSVSSRSCDDDGTCRLSTSRSDLINNQIHLFSQENPLLNPRA